MTQRQFQSISTRLTRMNLLVSGTVLLLAAMAFFSYDLLSFRANLVRNMDAEARIVADNSVSALLFDDESSATATLKSLQNSPEILSAVLVRDNGRIFAHYEAARQAPMAVSEFTFVDSQNFRFTHSRLLLKRQVFSEGKPVGTVYICATLGEIRARAKRYLLIAGVILIFCMAAALGISFTSQRLIARPMRALADTAQAVSRDQDYSLRAQLESDSTEIAVLIDSFNAMLRQIQERDAALIQAQNELESRVEERTAELQTANRELEAFSYTVAHDLRGPLDAISGLAFLLGQAGVESTAPQLIEQMQGSTRNMSTLIDDLLNFSRAKSTPLKAVPVRLGEIARSIAEELHSSEPEREVQFSIVDPSEVQADPGLIRIVLDNLLRNAWKYSSHHKQACIEFGVRNMDGKTVYFVRDDGAGFDPEKAGHLFRPFHRLHSKSEFAGTGIGLATVQRILARRGGEIWAEGAVEKGATFYFTL